jgi:hypothetical protein
VNYKDGLAITALDLASVAPIMNTLDLATLSHYIRSRLGDKCGAFLVTCVYRPSESREIGAAHGFEQSCSGMAC